MTILSRLQALGFAKESVAGTWLAPVRSIPLTGPKPEDLIEVLRDESVRGNDDVLQGIYGGASYSTFDYTMPHLYVDVLGDHLRAILGPDTYTAGVSTTLGTTTTAGATSISVALTIPAGSTVSIGTGVTQEWFISGTPTGSGPFVIPVVTGMAANGTSLLLPHTSGVAVVSAAKHVFAQDQRAAAIPSYSLTQYNKIEYRGYSGALLSDFSVKVDPKAAISADAKWTAFPSAVQTTTEPAFSTAQPFLGWQWTLTLGGTASTRGISGEFDLKRATAPVNSSDGTQGPREIFAGALELDLKFKAIFENDLDFAAFVAYNPVALVSTFTQPLGFGGASLVMTSTAQKATKFSPDFSGEYMTADIEGSAPNNSTDGGLMTATLTNWTNAQY